MSTTTSGELARMWAERVRAGAFSQAVAGTREVRVFGQAGVLLSVLVTVEVPPS